MDMLALLTQILMGGLLILAIMLLGLAVERAYRAFACRHPELGPWRRRSGGCGSCGSGHCARR